MRKNLLFLMLTVNEEDAQLFNTLESGAAPDKIAAVMRQVFDGWSGGNTRVVHEVAAQLIPSKPHHCDDLPVGLLSCREKEVLDLLHLGLLYKQIADRLHISECTVKTHCQHIYEKLQVSTRGEAVHRYFSKNEGLMSAES